MQLGFLILVIALRITFVDAFSADPDVDSLLTREAVYGPTPTRPSAAPSQPPSQPPSLPPPQPQSTPPLLPQPGSPHPPSPPAPPIFPPVGPLDVLFADARYVNEGSCSSHNAQAITSSLECKLMASSGQLAAGATWGGVNERLNTDKDPLTYAGCYSFKFISETLYFVPVTAEHKVEYGDGQSCSKYNSICIHASPSPPSPPVLPPSPPYLPLSEMLAGAGLSTTGTCESHGGRSITSTKMCEFAAKLLEDITSIRVVDEELRPEYCFKYESWLGLTIYFNEAASTTPNCTSSRPCLCTGLTSPPPSPPTSPPSPPPPLPPPRSPPSPPSPPVVPIIAASVRVVESGSSCEASNLTTIHSPDNCALAYQMVNASLPQPNKEYLIRTSGTYYQGCHFRADSSW
eukprot:CAMPEP_0119333208 /NCGR_PEP_ID=MMETSP1333-20130426/84610_1 /TAXON_ID=418940 /ORGANISM="Scyphosphaera apsteinii, Strain RCC1455" /LENGTH=402 /DNA_ID=CAMNT_0007343205 /DNA_START=24 /DNA_END=1229 /DNA_ORIENTATION=+